MKRTEKAKPFVPTEFHVSTLSEDKGIIGVLSIKTTEGLLDIALDHPATEALVRAVSELRSLLDPEKS